MSGIDKFFQAIDDVTTFILGDKRSGNERRVKNLENHKKKKKTGKQIMNPKIEMIFDIIITGLHLGYYSIWCFSFLRVWRWVELDRLIRW